MPVGMAPVAQGFLSKQCQLAHRCVGLSTAFVNILKYLVFRRSHPPGGRTLARRVSASNIIKRKRQAEVARNHANRRSAEARLPRIACAPSGSRRGPSARRRSANRLKALNGAPVRLAEVFKGLSGSRRVPAAGSQHDAPVGSGELSVLAGT